MAKQSQNQSALAEKFSQAAANNSGRVHVVPSRDGWAVKKEGVTRALVVKPTKATAVKAAKDIKSASKVVVHKRDGTIQSLAKKK